MTFVFDNDYGNKEQVRQWLPTFQRIRATIEAEGRYPYNDSFKGRIDGIEGADEDTAIYLLQSLHAIEQEHATIALLRSEGFEPLDTLSKTTRYPTVVLWYQGCYVGGTGRIVTVEDARVLPGEQGRPLGVLPKHKRSNGYPVGTATVLVRKEATA